MEEAYVMMQQYVRHVPQRVEPIFLSLSSALTHIHARSGRKEE